ncbi:MAG: serine/threonine protein kinase [Candidatus Riflebacteria bacterium]|nr:serine/threonine protein kinase [Candidatus Riflebacteria bacterium]
MPSIPQDTCPSCGGRATPVAGAEQLVTCENCQKTYASTCASQVSLLVRSEAGHTHLIGKIALSEDFRARYTLGEVLGQGAMGTVFKATRRTDGTVVAIKFMTQVGDPAALARFLREGALLKGIEHPGVVRMFELGELAGHPFLVAEYLGGGTLRRRIVGGVKVPYREAIPSLLECLSGLHECHVRGIIHRDLKPDNILFDTENRARLADFSLAKSYAMDQNVTVAGELLGTPRYGGRGQRQLLEGDRPLRDAGRATAVLGADDLPDPRHAPQGPSAAAGGAGRGDPGAAGAGHREGSGQENRRTPSHGRGSRRPAEKDPRAGCAGPRPVGQPDPATHPQDQVPGEAARVAADRSDRRSPGGRRGHAGAGPGHARGGGESQHPGRSDRGGGGGAGVLARRATRLDGRHRPHRGDRGGAGPGGDPGAADLRGLLLPPRSTPEGARVPQAHPGLHRGDLHRPLDEHRQRPSGGGQAPGARGVRAGAPSGANDQKTYRVARTGAASVAQWSLEITAPGAPQPSGREDSRTNTPLVLAVGRKLDVGPVRM